LIDSASSLVNAGLDRLGGALDERLRFGQTERGDFADGLDDLDLLGADFAEDHVEFRLLGSRAGAAAAPGLPQRQPGQRR